MGEGEREGERGEREGERRRQICALNQPRTATRPTKATLATFTKMMKTSQATSTTTSDKQGNNNYTTSVTPFLSLYLRLFLLCLYAH